MVLEPNCNEFSWNEYCKVIVNGVMMVQFGFTQFLKRVLYFILFLALPLQGQQSDLFEGYMSNGLGVFLPIPIVVDANVNQLYIKHAQLRKESNIELPPDFGGVINVLHDYIASTAAAGSESANGMSHLELAKLITEASFCFGTDPFMVAAKIRRETSFKRTGVSTGGAVGFSQMTGAGIKEVQHQMSGNSNISLIIAKSIFQKGIECFIGPSQFNYAAGDRDSVQNMIQSHPHVDFIFGQILTKTYVSYAKSSIVSTLNKEAYRAGFALYNGDSRMVSGQCMRKKVQLKFEYACDIMTYYNNISAN